MWMVVGMTDSWWSTERLADADKLVKTLLNTDADAIIRDGLRAEYRDGCIAVSNEHFEVRPVEYDIDAMTAFSTDSAIRDARIFETGGGSDNA